MPLVSLSGVAVSFGERRLLDSVNLTIATGSRTALVGPNGSGKTTLMRIMVGQSQPDTGAWCWRRTPGCPMSRSPGVVPAGCALREEAENAFAAGRTSWRSWPAGGAARRARSRIRRRSRACSGSTRAPGEAGGQRLLRARRGHGPRAHRPGFLTRRLHEALHGVFRRMADAHRPRPRHPGVTRHPAPRRADQLPRHRGAHLDGGVPGRVSRGAAPGLPRPLLSRRRGERRCGDLHDAGVGVQRQLQPLRGGAHPGAGRDHGALARPAGGDRAHRGVHPPVPLQRLQGASGAEQDHRRWRRSSASRSPRW